MCSLLGVAFGACARSWLVSALVDSIADGRQYTEVYLVSRKAGSDTPNDIYLRCFTMCGRNIRHLV